MTAGGPAVRSAGLGAAARRLAPVAVFAVFPALLVCLLLRSALELPGSVAFWDFHAFWNAGRDVLHGRSPYPPASAAVLAREQSFVYPAPAALLVAPLALLPFEAAAMLFALSLVAAVPLALRIAGVRDWRCYGVAMLSAPVVRAISLGAVTPLLAVGLALAWRYRDRRSAAAAAVAAVIVLKLFLWPLLLWLAFTRRLATAATAAVLVAVTSAGAWAVLGFDGLRAYPHLLRLLAGLLEGKGYSLVALGLSLGAGTDAARTLAVAAGVAALGLVALHGRRAGADGWTFTVAIGAALALSPIVWLHYFALLLVPLAISARRLAPVWFVPLGFWLVGGQSTDGPIWRHAPDWKTIAAGPRVGSAWVVAYTLAVAASALALSARRAPPASV